MTSEDIADLERAGLEGFVATDRLDIGEWVAVSGEIPARRLNSVYLIGDPGKPVPDAIADGALFLTDRGKHLIVKVAYPVGGTHPLDGQLADMGFAAEARTDVLTSSLVGVAQSGEVMIEEGVSERWLADRARVLDLSDIQVRQLRSAIVPPTRPVAFATLSTPEGIAQGRAITIGDRLGIFHMLTEAGARKQGMARLVLQSLVGWGVRQGATQGFLQVEVTNVAARRLYASMDFRLAYRYHYWRAPPAR